MKKNLLNLAAIAVLFVSLAACSSSKPEETTTTPATEEMNTAPAEAPADTTMPADTTQQ